MHGFAKNTSGARGSASLRRSDGDPNRNLDGTSILGLCDWSLSTTRVLKTPVQVSKYRRPQGNWIKKLHENTSGARGSASLRRSDGDPNRNLDGTSIFCKTL